MRRPIGRMQLTTVLTYVQGKGSAQYCDYLRTDTVWKDTMLKKLLDKAARLPVDLSDIMNPRKKWDGRVEHSSFHRVPAVTSFEIEPRRENLILSKTGIDRKLEGESTRVKHERNEQLNRYIGYRIRSMRLALTNGNPEEFWKIARREMRYSVAFRVCAFNSVLKG